MKNLILFMKHWFFWVITKPAIKFIGKEPSKTNQSDEYDIMAQEIIAKASKCPDFPMHHAIASHLRAVAVEGVSRGIKRERQTCLQIIKNFSKSWAFVLRYDAVKVCAAITKKIQERE